MQQMQPWKITLGKKLSIFCQKTHFSLTKIKSNKGFKDDIIDYCH